MPRRLAAAVAAGAAAVTLAGLAAYSGGGGGDAGRGDAADAGDRPPALVYLSGLDDHQLPAGEAVPLHGEPGGPVTAHAPAAALAWAHEHAGQWLAVTLAHDESVRGWVADYYLRGELHLVDPVAAGCPVAVAHQPGRLDGHHHLPPSTRVRLVDVAGHGGSTWVRVREVRGGGAWWVERGVLSERAGPDPRRARPGTPCERITPETAHPHDH